MHHQTNSVSRLTKTIRKITALIPGRIAPIGLIAPLHQIPEPPKGRIGRPVLLPSLLSACVLLFIAGCVSSSRSVAAFELANPQINRGLLTEEASEDGLRQMATTLALNESMPSAAGPTVPEENSLLVLAAKDETTGTSSNAPQSGTKAASAPVELPAESGKLIELPKLSGTELAELLSGLQLNLQAEKDYKPASASDTQSLPVPPEGIFAGPVLSKTTAEGKAILRFGHRRFLSQPARIWIQGIVFHPDTGAAGRNSDLDQVPGLVEKMITSVQASKQNLGSADLAYRLIQLSYIDVTGAVAGLHGFGITTAEDLTEVDLPIEFKNLPLVAPMPSPKEEQIRLLGSDKEAMKGAFELSVTPSVATPLPTDANTAPTSQLLVYYHPAHPDQFSRVKQLLDEFIDRPDRQIFVEGMVLEISEEGLSDLGIEWEFREGNFEWIVGSLGAPGAAANTLRANFDDLKDFDKNWMVRLRTLVRDGKAEVLSRPSVLTINNRQATIRVGTDIPIATSREQGAVSIESQLAFDFKYLATGISLNVMPRANERGDKVSLLIDTIVSAVVPGADLELRSSSGEVLASAPTMSTRRIQTYARIDNNTPFIIGGLVSKEHTTVRDKVPLLGDIPYLGALFRSKKSSTKKREVIIVLTPHVLASEKEGASGRYLPKDEDRFDEFGNVLFRDTYRIRSEDIFDLSFLTENQRLQQYRDLAKRAIQQDFRLAYEEPFSHFVGDRIPGEHILVHRMIFEVIKRLSTDKGKPTPWLDKQINPERLIVFESQQIGGFNVQFLERILTKLGDGKVPLSFFTKNLGKALAITFRPDRDVVEPGELAKRPIPTISLVDCPDDKAWNQLLWDMNQPDEKGNSRHTLLIHDKSDLVRLQRIVLLRKIVTLNGGESQMSLKHFSLGKVLLMPEAKTDQTHLIDAGVAQFFFETESYYGATMKAIEDTLNKMEETLKKPQFQLLD